MVNKMYIDGNLSPIGWSKDGKFAYAHCRYLQRDLRRIFITQVIVMDMISNEVCVIFSSSFSNEGKEHDDGITFSNFWRNSEAKITEILQQYNIISYPEIELQNPETLTSQYGLEIEFEYSEYTNTVFITNKSGERKKILTIMESYSEGKVLGYYKSPFNNRLVIYIKTGNPGSLETDKIQYIIVGYPV
jgi:hypothetical protein